MINSGNHQGLNLSLSHYKDVSAYYRAGDNSTKNLISNIIAISKENQATVSEIPSENYIMNGRSN